MDAKAWVESPVCRLMIYCFNMIQIKGMIYEWEFKRNQVACLQTILSEKHSQSCLSLPLRLWWRCYYCRMMQRKQEKVFYAVNWSVQMKMSAIAEDDWIWWPVKVPTHTAWSNAIVSFPFLIPLLFPTHLEVDSELRNPKCKIQIQNVSQTCLIQVNFVFC